MEEEKYSIVAVKNAVRVVAQTRLKGQNCMGIEHILQYRQTFECLGTSPFAKLVSIEYLQR